MGGGICSAAAHEAGEKDLHMFELNQMNRIVALQQKSFALLRWVNRVMVERPFRQPLSSQCPAG